MKFNIEKCANVAQNKIIRFHKTTIKEKSSNEYLGRTRKQFRNQMVQQKFSQMCISFNVLYILPKLDM